MTDATTDTGREDAAEADEDTTSVVALDTDEESDGTPDGGEPCPYCARTLSTARLLALHVGEVHGDDCTGAERDAYERAREAESNELFRYHVKVIAALVVITFGLIYTYVIVLS